MGKGVKQRLLDKYGEEEGLLRWSEIQERVKFSRSKEGYIARFGEEAGLAKWEETSRKKGNASIKSVYIAKHGEDKWNELIKKKILTKENLIERYGEEEGMRRWLKKKESDKKKGTKEGYIERYGEEEGVRKWLEKNSRLSVSVEALKKNGHTPEEIERTRQLHSKKSAHTKENFINRYGEEHGVTMWKEWKSKSRERSKFSLEYWIKHGYSETDAKKIISDIQSRNSSLLGFTDRYGKNVGLERYMDTNLRKTKHLLTSSNSVSKLEREFFEDLSDMSEGMVSLEKSRNQRIILNETSAVCVDYVNLDSMKVIEVFGGYFHLDPRKYKGDYYNERTKKRAHDQWLLDFLRISIMKDAGFQVLVIWEHDINTNRHKCLQDAIDFLTN